jgi:hypothetical protein
MATVRPLRQQQRPADEPLHARAMDNLAFIRDTMESAGAFTAVSGGAMVAIGVMALAAAGVAAQQPTPGRWLVTWLSAAVLAPVVQLLGVIRKIRAAQLPILRGSARKFLLSFVPSMLVGALLTVVFVRADLLAMLPALWLLMYGAAVVAGGAFSVPVVPVLGAAFMVAGALAFFSPESWNNWIMAAAFGGLHIGFGISIARQYGG